MEENHTKQLKLLRNPKTINKNQRLLMQTQAIPLHCNTEAEPAHYDLVYKLTQLSELTSYNYALVTKQDAHMEGKLPAAI